MVLEYPMAPGKHTVRSTATLGLSAGLFIQSILPSKLTMVFPATWKPPAQREATMEWYTKEVMDNEWADPATHRWLTDHQDGLTALALLRWFLTQNDEEATLRVEAPTV
jgi:hypothetical protein